VLLSIEKSWIRRGDDYTAFCQNFLILCVTFQLNRKNAVFEKSNDTTHIFIWVLWRAWHKTNVCIEQQNEYVYIATLGATQLPFYSLYSIYTEMRSSIKWRWRAQRAIHQVKWALKLDAPMYMYTDCRIMDLYVWVIEALY
jgi:hypothetical protein